MISKWVLKAVVQKIISYFPNRNRINYWFQKNITKGVELTDLHFEYKIVAASDHIAYFKKHAESIENKCVLELGTGWYPIVPIAMYLSNMDMVYSIDLSDWTSKKKILQTIRKFIEWNESGKLKDYLPIINPKRWSVIEELLVEDVDIDEICQRIKLKRIIGDARSTEFENNTIDFLCSNNTFEHIPRDILKDILIEQNRIAKKNSVISHFIDMSDHFAHIDNKIGIYNFLKFTSRQWGIIDNTIQPQNRMRFKDYLEMFGQTNFKVLETKIRKGDVQEVLKIEISNEFKSYSVDELAISHGYVVSRIM